MIRCRLLFRVCAMHWAALRALCLNSVVWEVALLSGGDQDDRPCVQGASASVPAEAILPSHTCS